MADRKEELAGKWCILRTAAPRTLPLAAALAEAGVAAWTPVEMVKRAGRGRDRHKTEQRRAPITPTFVFVPADRAVEMVIASLAPVSPYPPFSVLRRRDRGLALMRDQSLTPLRVAERQQLEPQQRKVAQGSSIRLRDGGFAGMTGILESDHGKNARVPVIGLAELTETRREILRARDLAASPVEQGLKRSIKELVC